MDWSLVIFVVVVAFFSYRGYKKGLVRSLSRVLSLLAGYIVTILYTEQFAAIVESQFHLQSIVAFIIAALILFIAGGTAVGLLFWLPGKLLPKKETPSAVSSAAGAVLGIALGAIVAAVIVWTFAFIRDIRPEKVTAAIPETKQSPIEILVNQAASQTVSGAMSLVSADQDATRISVALVQAPAEFTRQAQRLVRSDDLNALFGNPRNHTVLNRGDAKALQKLPAFRQLVTNPDMLALAKSAGMLDESADESAGVEAALASRIVDIWGRVQRVKNNRRAREILSDPEFQKKVQSGNPVDLLTSASLLELANIIFSDTSAPAKVKNKAGQIIADGDSGSVQPDSNLQATPEYELKIYSWVDEDGKIHYSDIEQKP